jgi:biotin transport system substrate-specific component
MTVRIDRVPAGTLLTSLTAGADMTGAIRAAAVLFVAALTAAASQISIPLPFTPVPFTLQPMIVLLGGAALGARLGMAAQVLYLVAGVAGLPVFAASPLLPQGVLRLVGPTGGFLLSYPLAAFVAGSLAERGLDRRYFTSVLAMSAGLAVIFSCGVVWFAWLARPSAGSLAVALGQAVYPFIVADILKLFVAAAVLPAAWRLRTSG